MSAVAPTPPPPRWALHQGDCLAILRDMPEGSADALITDPPYSSGGFTRGDRTAKPSQKYQQHGVASKYDDFTGDNRDQRGFLAWCSLWMGECFRLLREGAPVAIFTDWRQLPTTTDAVQAAGFVWRGIAVWTKNNASRPQLGRFRADAEYLVWGSKGPMAPYEGAPVLPGTFTCAPVHATEREHLTEKPIEVMETIVQLAAPEALILDPFAGSATTGAAALRRGRRFVGCELSRAIHAGALERLTAEEKSSTLPAIRAGQAALFG